MTYLTILENPFQCFIQMLFIPIAISYNIIPDLLNMHTKKVMPYIKLFG